MVSEDSTAVHQDALSLHQVGYRLVVLTGEFRGREFEVLRDNAKIGKSRQCEVTLPDDSVSRQHAEIEGERGLYKIRDQDSTNGTFVQGARVTEAYLKPGDVITLGTVQVRFTPRDGKAELLPSENDRFGELLGHSLAMRRIFAVLERVAASDVTVLVGGETGTGKDMIARALHDNSQRKDGPFVVVDCGASSAQLIEDELFGHEVGAFESAVSARPGAFEAANGGTIFLDEIGELPMEVQPKLLRVLETLQVRRLGSTERRAVDVRVIAASHRDLAAAVAEGEFREELYFRLAVVSCTLPALRDRREDIPMLIEAFSRRLPAGMWRAPSEEAMARLVGYDWPGNVRELRNVVERSAYLSPHGVIDLVSARTDAQAPPPNFDPTLTFREQKERAVEAFEEAYLAWLLERSSGNISRAARDADMDRKYLHKLLRRYGIDAKRFAK